MTLPISPWEPSLGWCQACRRRETETGGRDRARNALQECGEAFYGLEYLK